jgi:hypothetical protein
VLGGDCFIHSEGGVVLATFHDFPGWHFSARVIAEGLYEVLGVDGRGRRVGCTRTESLAAIDECLRTAAAIEAADAHGVSQFDPCRLHGGVRS